MSKNRWQKSFQNSTLHAMVLPCPILYRVYKLLAVFVIFTSFSAYAQQDALTGIVETDGSDKLSKLEDWSYNKLYFSKPLQKIELLKELEQLAIKKHDKVTQAYVIFYRGLYVTAKDGKKHNQGVTAMLKAIAMAEKDKQQLQVAYFKHVLGYYYFTDKKEYVPALQNMLQAHYAFTEFGYENVRDPEGMFDRLAFVYYHLNNFNETIRYLKGSLKYKSDNKRRHVSILNTIGQSYRELFQPDSAIKYFRISRQFAIRAKDTAWMGITSGNIGHFHMSQKAYAQAKPFMLEYYRYGLIAKDSALVVEALAGLADIARASGKIDEALGNLRRAETLLDQAFYKNNMSFENYVRKQYLFGVYASVWEAGGDAQRSLIYLKEANKIKDSIEKRAKLSKNIAIQQLLEAEQINNRLQLLNEEKQAAEMKQKLLIAIGLLLLIIFGLLYNRQIRKRKAQKQKEKLLTLEKEKIESDLQYAAQQLAEYVNHLRQKTELLDTTQSEMDSLRKQFNIPVEDEQMVLQKLSDATILTEDDWRKFRSLFEKVHSGFFQKLKTMYPGLTPAETRLCCLIKLGLNSHEMAAMMGISTMSIKKSRQRLRKKIHLDETDKLEDLFCSL